jgi:hypothetical protein
VLRFTDDTVARIELGGGGARRETPVSSQAQKLASEFEPRLAIETGVNLPARLATSLLDAETPGVFFAQFDGGRRGRFTVLLDHQARLQVPHFSINAGERGLIFQHQQGLFINDVWMAFHSTAEYERGQAAATYSDATDLVDVIHYDMDVDLRQLDKRIGILARMTMQVKASGVRAVPFSIGESLTASRSTRLEKQLRVKAVRLAGQPLAFAQEDWDGTFTVFLPAAAQAGQGLELEVELDGHFMRGGDIPECFYPVSNTDWYPRHGYLDRASFNLTFRHRKRDKIASIGLRLGEKPDPDDKNATITIYRMPDAVALAVFAVGPFERHTQQVKWESGGQPIPLEFNSVPARVAQIKEDFLLAELDNAVRYFAATFGRYPYPAYGAAFHHYVFGQGFPSLLMIPPTTVADRRTYAFLAHEAAHQWWGNIVAWRSYRDQWLSEGFAEYSGVLYTELRDTQNPKAAAELIREMRDSLRAVPLTALGAGKGRLNDIGPIGLGLRLHSSKSVGAYQALVYNKGALVLRMLHFLMSDPQSSPTALAGQPFFAMMTDFVQRFRNKSATTRDFQAVANAHFARSPIAQKFGMKDLDWFFSQWVERTTLPAYALEYDVAEQPDKSFLLRGSLRQEGVDAQWSMPLPIVFTLDGNQTGRTVVRAVGPETPIELRLPARPRKVELDPAAWVLSEKTTTKVR